MGFEAIRPKPTLANPASHVAFLQRGKRLEKTKSARVIKAPDTVRHASNEGHPNVPLPRLEDTETSFQSASVTARLHELS